MASGKVIDVAIIGGGIVGLATARDLSSRSRVVVLEAEGKLAQHQTGHNSGVIHSGLYYKPGSLKARNCAAGRDAMYRFCEQHEIPHDNCGKIVVATSKEELPALDELERRGKENGLVGMTRLDAAGVKEHEPHIIGIAGLHVPETGIADYVAVCQAMAEDVRRNDGQVKTDCKVTAVERRGSTFTLVTTGGEFEARYIVNCGGLQCDRVAEMCGVSSPIRIVPFRGEYYKLAAEKEYLVKHLVYPVPDPRFPFLGVHFTRMIGGGIEAGPNAVLALKREGYSWSNISARDLMNAATYSGFWRMAGKYWKTGFGEVHRSLSKAAFVRALQKLLPELEEADVVRHGAGVRAQAVAPDGKLLDDFCIVEEQQMLHVLNAPSPGATASLAIGASLASRVAAAGAVPAAC